MFSIKRNTNSIKNKSYDVLVVGGGVVGSASALESSLLGLKTLLIDKSDFGSKTSTGCFKIVHGGLRYLQHLDIVRLRESVSEQTAMRKMAPHLVKPLPFLVPTYSKLSKSKAFLGCGVGLYELLSADKNRGFSEEDSLKKFRILNKQETLAIAPGLNQDGLTGAVVYYDAQMNHSERLTFAYAQTAAREGTSICNYLELVAAEVVYDGGGEFSSYLVTLLDVLSGHKIKVNTLSVVNASGPWCSRVEKLFGVSEEAQVHQKAYSKGVQVVLPQLIDSYGLAVESEHKDPEAIVSRGGRSYFMHPWRGCTLLGTTDSIHSAEPDTFAITKKEVSELISSASKRYKDSRISEENVRYAFGGLRQIAGDYDVDTLSHDSKVSMHPELKTHRSLENFVSVVGVKYTTCRSLAKKVIREVADQLGMGSFVSKSRDVVLVGGEDSVNREGVDREKTSYENGFFADQYNYLYDIYGSQLKAVLSFAKAEKDQGEDNPNLCLAKAEIENAVANEMAVSLEDVLQRRTSLAQTGVPEETVVALAAERLAVEFSWSAADREEAISSFFASFSLSK